MIVWYHASEEINDKWSSNQILLLGRHLIYQSITIIVLYMNIAMSLRPILFWEIYTEDTVKNEYIKKNVICSRGICLMYLLNFTETRYVLSFSINGNTHNHQQLSILYNLISDILILLFIISTENNEFVNQIIVFIDILFVSMGKIQCIPL